MTFADAHASSFALQLVKTPYLRLSLVGIVTRFENWCRCCLVLLFVWWTYGQVAQAVRLCSSASWKSNAGNSLKTLMQSCVDAIAYLQCTVHRRWVMNMQSGQWTVTFARL